MGTPAPLAILWAGPGAGANPPGTPPPTADLAPLLAAELPGWRILVLRAPWDDLRSLQRALAGARGRPAVVAAPAGAIPPRLVREVAARAGLDMSAVQLVDPWPGCCPDGAAPRPDGAAPRPGREFPPDPPDRAAVLARAARLVTGAAARAAACPGTPADALRLRLPAPGGAMARRGVSGARRPVYEVIPWVDPGRCRAATGCALCAAACPAGAIDTAGGTAILRPDACSGCSICAAACPTGAITDPGAAPAMLAAQVRALLRPGAPRPAIIAYACPGALAALGRAPRAGAAVPPGVLPVPVPCAAAVPTYLLLHPLELGAAAVAVLACAAPCRHGAADGAVGGGARWAQEYLALLGQDPRRVALLRADPRRPEELAGALAALAATAAAAPAPPDLPPEPPPDPVNAFAALGALVRRHPGRGALAGPHVPFGAVAVDAGRCTFCGLCTAVCPTGALAMAGEDSLRLELDPLACAACGACAPACPAGAVAVQRGLDLAHTRAPRVLAAGAEQRCPRCGQPHASAALAAQVRSRLARTLDADRLSYLDYCPDCRLAATLRPPTGARSGA